MEPTSTYRGTLGTESPSGAVQRGVESTGAALHSGIDKLSDPARSALDGVSSAAHETVSKIASTASSTAERLSEQTRWLAEAPGKAVESSRSWVRDRPFEAVGAALAFGFIVGRFTGR